MDSPQLDSTILELASHNGPPAINPCRLKKGQASKSSPEESPEGWEDNYPP